MTDFWRRCRAVLHKRLARDDYCLSIEPLRAWLDGGVLYLWVDRARDDWRSISNPARDFDSEIREAVELVWGRPPKSVRYLDRPPNRESRINDRRRDEHRTKTNLSQANNNKRLLEYALEECRKLEANPPNLGACRSDAERQVKLSAIVMDRAQRRLAKDVVSTKLLARRRREPPRTPPARP